MTRLPYERRVIFLARMHKYVHPIVFILLPVLLGSVLVAGIGCLLFALYDLVGYRLRWRHIYCYIQDGKRLEMTPNNIKWYELDNDDIFGTPAILGFVGIAFIIISLFVLPNV